MADVIIWSEFEVPRNFHTTWIHATIKIIFIAQPIIHVYHDIQKMST